MHINRLLKARRSSQNALIVNRSALEAVGRVISHLVSFGREWLVKVGTTQLKNPNPVFVNLRAEQLKLPAKMLGGSATKLGFLTRFGWEKTRFHRVTLDR
jgi:hypothetical protein